MSLLPKRKAVTQPACPGIPVHGKHEPRLSMLRLIGKCPVRVNEAFDQSVCFETPDFR